MASLAMTHDEFHDLCRLLIKARNGATLMSNEQLEELESLLNEVSARVEEEVSKI